MAEIYKATDTVLERDVAVKVLADAASDEDVRARFGREALAAARLSDGPHTVATYDVGELDGRPFLVMEYLAGGSLADRLAAGGFSEEQVLTWLEQAARALDHAHAHGVVHRDVKPGNLLLDESGSVRVADFGIARGDGLESHTQTGVVLGTAGYLAPEQVQGSRATAASDRYALAVVAHELLTGARPGATPPSTQPAVAGVLSLALATNPAERFPSCLAFVAALRQALAGSEAPTVVMQPPRSRRMLALAAGALCLGGLGVVLAVGLSAQGGTDKQRAKPPSPPMVARSVTVPASTIHQAAVATPRRAAEAQKADDVRGEHPGKGHKRGHGRGHGKKEKDEKG